MNVAAPQSRFLRATYSGYLVLFFVYLAAPLVAAGGFAFNDSTFSALPWKGFTLDWFFGTTDPKVGMFHDRRLLRGMGNSLYIGVIVAALSVVVGTCNAFLFERKEFPFKSVLYILMVLPLVIQPRAPGQPVRLQGEIDFGVCSDVCIPARLNFDGALDPAAPRNPAIAAALAARPYSATEAGVPPARCRVAPTGDGLAVTVRMTMPSAGTPETVVIEPPAPDLWASETETTRAGGVLTARAELSRADGKPFALDRSGLRITVLGTRRAVDIRGCTAE